MHASTASTAALYDDGGVKLLTVATAFVRSRCNGELVTFELRSKASPQNVH